MKMGLGTLGLGYCRSYYYLRAPSHQTRLCSSSLLLCRVSSSKVPLFSYTRRNSPLLMEALAADSLVRNLSGAEKMLNPHTGHTRKGRSSINEASVPKSYANKLEYNDGDAYAKVSPGLEVEETDAVMENCSPELNDSVGKTLKVPFSSEELHASGPQITLLEQAGTNTSHLEQSATKVGSEGISSEQKSFTKKRSRVSQVSKMLENQACLDADLESRLQEMNKSNLLDTLTVPELRKIMVELGKPPSGRKKDLVMELQKHLDHNNGTTQINHNPGGEGKLEGNMKSSLEAFQESKEELLVHKNNVKKRGNANKISKANAGRSEENESLVNAAEPWAMLVHKKVQPDWFAYNPTTMRCHALAPEVDSVKLISWNVNGLRSLLKDKGDASGQSLILKLAWMEDFDVLCLQETKIQVKDVEQIKASLLDGYEHSFWSCSTSKLGYSGTAIISRMKPLSVTYGLEMSSPDDEGRLITVEFESFFLVAGYIPNSGEKLQRLTYRTQEWDPSLSHHIKVLEEKKPVVLTGDFNCAHEEMDIYNPDGNRKSAGFTNEERGSLEVNFLNKGLVDTFRHQHPNAVAYTYWGYRTNARSFNRGWRLDYFLVSQSLMDKVHDSYVLPAVLGSDHCPIGLILKS